VLERALQERLARARLPRPKIPPVIVVARIRRERDVHLDERVRGERRDGGVRGGLRVFVVPGRVQRDAPQMLEPRERRRDALGRDVARRRDAKLIRRDVRQERRRDGRLSSRGRLLRDDSFERASFPLARDVVVFEKTFAVPRGFRVHRDDRLAFLVEVDVNHFLARWRRRAERRRERDGAGAV
jgi:hypothetical protein